MSYAPTPMRRMSGRGGAVLVASGVALLLGLRLLLIDTSVHDLLYWEEPYRLVIALELLAGPTWPLVEYQADHYQGGSLAVGLLATPVLALLGPTYGHLKVVAVGFTLLTALAWVIILWRAVGPLAAALGAWFLALAPPSAQIYQVHAMGSHAETALFTAAGFLVVLSTADRKSSHAPALLLGVIAGLGIWFCYTAVTGIAAWAIVWLTTGERRRSCRDVIALAAGTVLGVTPWLAYNVAYGFQGVERVTQLLGTSLADPIAVPEPLTTRVAALLAVDLPRALGFPETTLGVPSVAAWIVYGTGISVFVALVIIAAGHAPIGPAWLGPAPLRYGDRIGEGPRSALVARLIVLLVTLHVLVFLASSFRLDVENGYIAYRFFAPLFPPFAAGLAIVVATFAARGKRLVAAAAALLVLASGAYGSATLFREHRGEEKRALASAYGVMGLLTHLKYRHDIGRAAERLAQLHEPMRRRAFFGYGWGLEYQYEKDTHWPSVIAGLAHFTRPTDRAAALDGLRWAVRKREQQSRAYANAGFRPEYHRLLHRRVASLLARLGSLDPAAL